ncbi:hypothetical protein MB901379_01239 [Mycobacterium basiliense]|uniref:Uncharacterized protein n=1 Tax=Mycobacterium basiliense TaxID=2094119 RepID=A0A447GB54_9MYCO|nr:hypothetical protein [Mycobacterium basiliense]VDM87695.1 hypothetical protein MB901379_01239 [Mycobacterium basiliense]
MGNAEVAGPHDAVPEADAADQRLEAGFDDEAGLDTTYLSNARERDANEADVIDQAYIVPPQDDDLDIDR